MPKSNRTIRSSKADAVRTVPQVVGEGDELVLIKDGRRYVFSCPPGEESNLLNRLATMVSDPRYELDWFDAAILSRQVGERMMKRILGSRK